MKPSEPIEVESQAVAVRPSGAVVNAGNPLDLSPEIFKAGLARRKENRAALMEWIRSALVEGTDFGKIHTVKKSECALGRRCTNPYHFSKPSLFKPGSEKICGMLGVTPTFPTLKDYEDACLKGVKLATIMLRCEIQNTAGQVIAVGVGARDCGKDYFDINKSLKMAEKSAMIDATLRMGGLSETFTQDVEDMNLSAAPDEEDPGYLDKDRNLSQFPRTDNLGAGGGSGTSQRQSDPNTTPNAGRSVESPGTGRSTRTDSKPVQQKSEGPFPTEETRKKMITQLEAGPGQKCRSPATEYLRKAGMLMPNEEIEDLPLRWVPATVRQMSLLEAARNDFVDGEEAKQPYASHIEPSAKKTKKDYQLKADPKKPAEVPREAPTGNWREFVIPFGKQAGQTLGQIPESSLAWWVSNYKVEVEYNGRAKKPETIAKDKRFREALDAAKAEMGIEEREFAGD